MARGGTVGNAGADSAAATAPGTRSSKGARTAAPQVPRARAQSDEPPPASTAYGMPLLRTAGAVAYAPVAITEQLLSRSRPLWYYAGVATLAGVGAIDWPVAGVVIAGVWVARRRPPEGGSVGSADS